MHRGYVKLWRKSFDSGLQRDHKTWALWTYILCNVTYKKMDIHINGKTEHLVPGQILTGRKTLAEQIGVSEQNIRTCLQRLKNYGNLTIKSTNRYSILSVVNWNTYQQDEVTSNQLPNQQVTSNQPATNHKQEGKEVKKVKNKLPVWLDIEVWKEFKSYRQNGKGKFTPYAQQLAIKKLEKFKAAGNDPSEVMKQSILHGWSGLFEIKKEIREEAQERQKTNDKLKEYRRQEGL